MNINNMIKKQYEDSITTVLLVIQNLWSMRSDAEIMENQYRDVLSLLTDASYGLSEIMANQMK